MARASARIFSRDIVVSAVRDSFPKLDPRSQVRNPVMFIVELGSLITTVIFFVDLARGHTGDLWFVAVISIWLEPAMLVKPVPLAEAQVAPFEPAVLRSRVHAAFRRLTLMAA